MIQVRSLRRADRDDPPHFELQYIEVEKAAKEKGYFNSTKYGPEPEIRDLLRAGGIAEAEIDQLFANANRGVPPLR